MSAKVLSQKEGAALMLAAALDYAATGQPVFPVHPAGKSVKHPVVLWSTEATTDPERIVGWWERWPYAIGLPTGVLVDVLDIDTKPGRPNGYVALKLLDALGMLNGVLRWATTPSGGCHAYFPACPDMPNTTYARHGVDLRGKGGYVLAPPSYIETRDYAGGYQLLDRVPAGEPAPFDWRRMDRLLVGERKARLERSTPAPGSGSERLLEALAAEVGAARPGERNSTLFRKTCRALEYGLDTAPLEQAARDAGLTSVEIARTTDSALKRVKGGRP
jgi:hypothetical protein